jgi:hypothetical protein
MNDKNVEILVNGKTMILPLDIYEKIKHLEITILPIGTGYPCIYGSRLIHRIVMAQELAIAPDDIVVDHINGNTFDARRENLRIVSLQQNNFNRKKKQKKGNGTNTSQYKGVCKKTKSKNFTSSCGINGINYHLGSFELQEEAAYAYNIASKLLHGENGKQNNILEMISDERKTFIEKRTFDIINNTKPKLMKSRLGRKKQIQLL